MKKQIIRILLVEDDEDDFIITDELLSDVVRSNYELDWVTTYSEALSLMIEQNHHIYLVDYRLGPYNGLDLIREAIQGGCQKPVILLTGQGGMNVDIEAMESGVSDFLVKGKIDSQLLERSIRYAIERNRHEQYIQQRLEEEVILSQVTTEIASATDLDTALQRACQELAKYLGVPQAGFVLIDPDNKSAKMVADYNPENDFSKLGTPIPIDGNPSMEYILKHKQPLNLADALNDPLVESIWDLIRKRNIHSMLIVPVVANEKVLGTFGFDSYTERVFNPTEVETIQNIASQIGQVLLRKRAETAEHEQRILAETLRDTAAILNSTLDINEILGHVLDGVGKVVPHDAANIMLIDAGIARVTSQQGYLPYGCDNWLKNTSLIIADTHNYHRIVQTLQHNLIPDTTADCHWSRFPETSWIKSHLAVPILRDNTVVGVINLDSETPNFFNDDHANRLLAFADQVSVALENATLYQDALKAANRRAALHQVSQEMVATSRWPEKVYESIHQAVSRLMPCEAFSISTTNDKPGKIQGVYLYDKGIRYPVTYVDEEDSFSRSIIKSSQSRLIEDLDDLSDFKALRFGEGDHVRSLVAAPLQLNGKTFGMIATQSYSPNAYTAEDQRLLEMLAAMAATALESARLFEETQKYAQTQEALNNITHAALAVNTPDAAMKILADSLRDLIGSDHCFITIWDEGLGKSLPGAISGDDPVGYHSLKVEPGEITLTASVLEVGHTIVVEDVFESPYISPRIAAHFPTKSMLGLPLVADEGQLGAALIGFNEFHSFTPDEIRLGENAAGQLSLALAKIKLLDEAHRRASELEVVADVSESLRMANTRDEIPPIIVEKLIDLFNVDGAVLAIQDPNTLEIVNEISTGIFTQTTDLRFPDGAGIVGHVITTGKPYQSKNILKDALYYEKTIIKNPVSLACVPLIVQDRTIGALIVGRERRGKNGAEDITPTQLRLLAALSNIAANSLHRSELHERTQKQLERLTALHEIDRAISASFDLNLPFNMMLEKIIAQLDVDAAVVLLLDPNLQRLKPAANRGFPTSRILNTSLRLGEPYAGLAASECRPILIENLVEDGRLASHPLVTEEGFISYYGIPLMSKGKVNGVLELFNREPVTRDPEWFDFVKTLAMQASIAINNTELFKEAQRSNIELALAYDATIEGWAKTLELRDMETEGHSHRVTDMAVRLAQEMRIQGNDLVHFRRGALLHDIGKIGVPDSVLFKAGPLTEAEWEVMRNHPVHAYNLLLSISFLRRAVDIPHYHHEKWDGSGYPQGLQGEQIPLAARIFALVDVWDALSSDRPYRKAWDHEKVIDYLREQSGSHFDPSIVEVFIDLLEREDR